MRESDNGTCPVKKVFWTLIELFCNKRLFSRETAFFPDYLTRDKNGKKFVLQEIQMFLYNK